MSHRAAWCIVVALVGLAWASACGVTQEKGCGIGGSFGDADCSVWSNCTDTAEHTYAYECGRTLDGGASCTCTGGNGAQFQNGCAGTGAQHLRLLKETCGFSAITTPKDFCAHLGGTADDCAALSK